MDSKNLIFTYTGKLLNVKMFLNIFGGSDEKKKCCIYITWLLITELRFKAPKRDKTWKKTIPADMKAAHLYPQV